MSDAKREFLRENVIDLRILKQAHTPLHAATLAKVTKQMEDNEITMFPLGNDKCIVRHFTTDDLANKASLLGRIYHIPSSISQRFQRYGRLGQRPMTKTEFEALHRQHADPNTRLSRDK